MNVNFNGYGENVATFMADSTVTEAGIPVKVVSNGTVAKCESGDSFCGICVGVREGYAAVQLLNKGIGNRVVGMNHGVIVDYDIYEALNMVKPFDKELYEIANITSI